MLTTVLQELTGVGVSGLLTVHAAKHVEEACNTDRGLVPSHRKCDLKFCAKYKYIVNRCLLFTN